MADEEGATTTTTTTRKCSCSCCDCLWVVTTIEGWLKLVQAIMTFLTFVIVSSFPGSFRAEYEYLIFVATTAFIFVILHMILRMTHLFEKLPPALTQPLLGMICCFLAALALLIGSAVVFAKGKDYNVASLEASGICGFISTVLFFCEGVYFAILYRHAPKRRAEEKRPEESIQADDFVQPTKPAY
ncbi:hypothetical protein OS493_020373 [Desmophyllum pertusum]|uniref:MARVEL domain-containing protein n=1 Tax=Desmophyllum pertusum TaxID=174260 RepID=A0A9W9ZN69_9CNID|nr:hypothetical protein OS493_020373 [Desmophyllum pertusum]